MDEHVIGVSYKRKKEEVKYNSSIVSLLNNNNNNSPQRRMGLYMAILSLGRCSVGFAAHPSQCN